MIACRTIQVKTTSENTTMEALTTSHKQLALIISVSVVAGALGGFCSAALLMSGPVEAAGIKKLGDTQIDTLYVHDVRLLTATNDVNSIAGRVYLNNGKPTIALG